MLNKKIKNILRRRTDELFFNWLRSDPEFIIDPKFYWNIFHTQAVIELLKKDSHTE